MKLLEQKMYIFFKWMFDNQFHVDWNSIWFLSKQFSFRHCIISPCITRAMQVTFLICRSIPQVSAIFIRITFAFTPSFIDIMRVLNLFSTTTCNLLHLLQEFITIVFLRNDSIQNLECYQRNKHFMREF